MSKLEKIDDMVHPAADADSVVKEAADDEKPLPVQPSRGDKSSSADVSSSTVIASSPRSKNNRLQQARDIMAKMKTRLQYKPRK